MVIVNNELGRFLTMSNQFYSLIAIRKDLIRLINNVNPIDSYD